MNFKEILELIDKVAAAGISAVEVEQAGTKVRIEGKAAQTQLVHSYVSDVKTDASAHAPAAALQPKSEAVLPRTTSK